MSQLRNIVDLEDDVHDDIRYHDPNRQISNAEINTMIEEAERIEVIHGLREMLPSKYDT